MDINYISIVNKLSLLLTFGYSFFAIFLWGIAFIYGGSVTMTINDYGEMYPELVMLTFFAPIMVIGFINNLKRLYESG
jgi:hypothetical protein